MSNTSSIRSSSSKPLKRALLYGHRDSVAGLIPMLLRVSEPGYECVGFLQAGGVEDAAPPYGLSIVGTINDLSAIKEEMSIDTLLIALNSESPSELISLLERCQIAELECKVVADSGRSVRDLRIEDILRNESPNLDQEQIRKTIAGAVVLVTGAAGSIGAELCQQIAKYDPAAIIALDCAETPLFELTRRMHSAFPKRRFIPEIANIQRPVRMNEIMARYRPDTIFHAAAYKHVPLMEDQIVEAVENNVLGTYHLARAAEEYGVREFVLISSDKAIRPTSVMGATKRIAECLVSSFQDSATRFVAVRFGNVLGSAGSVVPIFQEQIASGGPLTITHQEMTRFFMTSAEACQLVLQAAAVGQNGEVCVLDMGQPIHIVDLAQGLILLAGRKPDDIAIQFIGTRPGEKLHEEIAALREDTVPGQHEQVRSFLSEPAERSAIERWIVSLLRLCETRDERNLLDIMKEIVQDYTPSTHVLKRIAIRRPELDHIEPLSHREVC